MESRMVMVLLGMALLALCWSGCQSKDGDGGNNNHSDASIDDSAGEDDSDTGQDSDSESSSEFIGDGGTDTDSEEVDTAGCGNGVIDYGEICDDSNSESGDGCSAGCDQVEEDYACPVPGEECVSSVKCGDRAVSGDETCDDGNAKDGDGCSATCQQDEGWICPTPGEKCFAALCGDGIVAGNEQCDDKNDKPLDGCSELCKIEEGYACGDPGTPCKETVCNDGKKEGSEPCDDGNDIIGDGCSPYCEVEPQCGDGACSSACGDGMILPNDDEECDDGNTKDADGCSSECLTEPGYICEEIGDELPDVLEVPITYRDFIAIASGPGVKHPDFETYSGQGTPGLVENLLGPEGKPVYTGVCETGNFDPADCPYNEQTTSQESFDQWYRDVQGINLATVSTLSLSKQPDGSYYFPDSAFFPLDDDGFVAAGQEAESSGHNFGFTSELRTWFEYKGDEFLTFSGDDDVWVFINRHLAVDLGGLHSKKTGSVTLNNAKALEFELEVGNVYEIVLFHAERHTGASNFNLTLGGFVKATSTCQAKCGDGIVAGDESCDDGVNDGSWGSCTPECTMGPYCGDGAVQSDHEECDDGLNLTNYSFTSEPACAPGCKLGAYCGDGKLNGLFGEQCDDGVNGGGYGECTSECQLDIRCGDGVLQKEEGEVCDDGNTVSGDGCSSVCSGEGPV